MLINANKVPVIIVSSNATAREEFAAGELQKYLEKILGVKLSVVDDQNCFSEQQIIIGGPIRNAAARELISEDDFRKCVPGPEGFLIQSFGESKLLLAGSEGDRERGTIYAVYEFLERYFGCSLAAYSHPNIAAGEWIPRMENIELHEVLYSKACADRTFRGACVQYSDDAGNTERGLNIAFLDWLTKNRYNYIFTWMQVYERLKENGIENEARRRGIEFMVGHHDASDLFLPPEGNKYFPEKYYETHPEYYRLQEDGTRYHVTSYWGQMVFCSRNQGLIEQISNNIITWLAENPGVKMIQLAPHDGKAPQCVCDMCKPYSKTENYTYFMNEVAKRVSAVYPDVKMVQLIYVDIWECPENVELSPSLMIIEATWYQADYEGLRTAGKSDGSSLNGTHFEENLLKWKKAGAPVFYYDYYMGVYGARQRYLPMADEIQPIWRNFADKGISGALTQIECFNMWNHIFNFYTFGRTAYDNSLSMKANLKKFVKIFGEGAPWIEKIICTAENTLEGQTQIPFGAFYLMEHIDKEEIYKYYEKALNAASTPLARNNVRLMRMAFRYTDLETQQENARSMEYQEVRHYANIHPELLHMTNYDSYWKNDPGYGICIPTTGNIKPELSSWEPDKWYYFE